VPEKTAYPKFHGNLLCGFNGGFLTLITNTKKKLSRVTTAFRNALTLLPKWNHGDLHSGMRERQSFFRQIFAKIHVGHRSTKFDERVDCDLREQGELHRKTERGCCAQGMRPSKNKRDVLKRLTCPSLET